MTEKNLLFGKAARVFLPKKSDMEEVIKFASVPVEPVRAKLTKQGESVISSVETLYRAPFGGGDARYYFTLRHNFFFAGYSLWTTGVVAKSQYFIDWVRRSGIEGQEYAVERREYGSFFHHVVAELERNEERRFYFNQPAEWVKETMKAYTSRAGLALEVAFDKWWAWLKNDMYAWLLFKKENNVRVLACELPVFDENFKIASPIDIVCVMTHKKKDVFAIIDIKATDKPIGDNLEYKLQLAFLKHAFNNQYSNQTGQIEHTFNWSLMDRAKSPGKFRLTEQSFDEDFSADTFVKLASLCKDLRINEPSGYLTDFIDDEDGPAMVRTRPTEWLKEFQKMMNKSQKKKRSKKS